MNAQPVHVKLSASPANWDFARQTPGRCLRWGRCVFHLNTEIDRADYWVVWGALDQPARAVCPPHNTIFVAGEPSHVHDYRAGFLHQFGAIVGPFDEGVAHRRVLLSHGALPWHVGRVLEPDGSNRFTRSYDDLVAAAPETKTALLSTICSDRRDTEGQRRRRALIDRLRLRLGDRLAVFGRGERPIPDKWDAIAPYHWHLVLENGVQRDYWTEKLADALLAWSAPIYAGCPNIHDYFAPGAVEAISLEDLDAACDAIERLIEREPDEARRAAVASARRLVLDAYNLFAVLARLCRQPWDDRLKRVVALRPETDCPIQPAAPDEDVFAVRRALACEDRLAESLHPSILLWRRDRGDEFLRAPGAEMRGGVAADLGGFRGDWSAQALAAGAAQVHVVEPMPAFAQAIRERFAGDARVIVHDVGLASAEGRAAFRNLGDASTAHCPRGADAADAALLELSCCDAATLLDRIGAERVAVMKMNIEGAEFDVLERLAEAGLLERIDTLHVQFHDFVPDYTTRLVRIWQALGRTHDRIYFHPMIWEGWRRRGAAPAALDMVPAGPEPLVSVIMPAYNRAVFVPRALHSVIEQDGVDRSRLEVIVIDDGSVDGTADVAWDVDVRDATLRVIQIPHVGLPGVVRNQGLHAARGRYIAYCDSDDFWLPHHLATLVPRLERDPDLAMVSSFWGFALFTPHADGRIDTEYVVPEHSVDSISTNCRVHRRSCLDEVGCFNDDAWGEDQDFFQRIERRFPTDRVRMITNVNGYIKGGNNVTFAHAGDVRRRFG